MKLLIRHISFLIIIILIIPFYSCKKLDKYNQEPEIEPLQHGLKTSAAIGYCASLASMAFNGKPLPDNVLFQENNNDEFSSSGILFLNITETSPVPFNGNIGEITIAGLWNEGQGGVITIIFTDFDLFSLDFEFVGIHTIPIIINDENQNILTLFAEQDIIIGEGSDTLLNLNMSKPQFDRELERLNSEQPTDIFAAVKQNIWFVTIDQNNTYPNIYDDEYTINGGGQIAEVTSTSGGILYHALIQTKYNYATCDLNPHNGVGFIQNIKAGSEIDLGNITLEFKEVCEGKAKVVLASGKYSGSNNKNINLRLN